MGEAIRSKRVAVLGSGVFIAVVALFAWSPSQADAAQNAPEIESVASRNSPFGNTYYLGDEIVAGVTFDKPVRVQGRPLLALTIGSQTRHAEYTGLDGSRTWAFFRYRVVESDTDTDGYGIPANAVSLNGGAIRDESDESVDAVLTHAALTTTPYSVDGSQSPAPTVHVVSISGSPESGGVYKQYESISVTVRFSRNLRVTGNPQIALTIGSNTRHATFQEVSQLAQNLAYFSYTVQSSDLDANGISIPANAISLNGATITGPAGVTSANLVHTELADDSRYRVDGSTATTLRARTPYLWHEGPKVFTRCEGVRADVSFRHPLLVSGSPTLRLDIGGVTREARFSDLDGDDNKTMSFRYEVMAEDSDTNGISIPANAISLNGGSIVRRDIPEITADITHAAQSTYRSLTVDGSASSPNKLRYVFFASNEPADGEAFSVGEAIYLWAVFSHSVEVTGTPQLALTVGNDTAQAEFQYVVRAWPTYALFAYIVTASDMDVDGVTVAADALSLNGGTIARTCDSAAPNLAHAEVSGGLSRKVDGGVAVAPNVRAVRFGNRPKGGLAYNSGEMIEASVTFDRAVTVTGTPQLGLIIGNSVRQAGFQRLEQGGLIAIFGYTVQPSDADTDGISIPANAVFLNGFSIALKSDSSSPDAATLTHPAVPRDPTRKVQRATGDDDDADTYDDDDDTDDDDDDDTDDDGDGEPACTTRVAPYWRGTGGIVLEPANGRSVDMTLSCDGRTKEETLYARDDGLIVQLLGESLACRSAGTLSFEGAEPGGWYWINGNRNAAVSPLVCEDSEPTHRALDPGGVSLERNGRGAFVSHDMSKVIAVLPDTSGTCTERYAPLWLGAGGLVGRPVDGETATLKVRCSLFDPPVPFTLEPDSDGIVRKVFDEPLCVGVDGNTYAAYSVSITGAEAGAWYWVTNERNAAASPFLCDSELGGPEATDPGGVDATSGSRGTLFKHRAQRLIGIVPHVD